MYDKESHKLCKIKMNLSKYYTYLYIYKNIVCVTTKSQRVNLRQFLINIYKTK